MLLPLAQPSVFAEDRDCDMKTVHDTPRVVMFLQGVAHKV